MHLFVKDLQGHSLSMEADSVSSLSYLVSDRTGIPIQEQRLIFGSRQLVACQNELESYGLVNGATVGLALRLRGGAPKKRCAFYVAATEKCSSPAVRIVGDCNYCESSFCGRHRLPEDHACTNLADCRKQAFDSNKESLEAYKTVGEKVTAI